MTRFTAGRILITGALLSAVPPVAAAQGAQGSSPGSIPKFVNFDTTGMFQGLFFSAGDRLFVAGQPTEKGLREMKARGVTTVVNLRSPGEMARVGFDEAAVVKQLGMQYVYLPMRGDSVMPFTPAAVKSLAAAIAGTDGKVLLHCTVAWRARHLYGAYLVTEMHAPLDEVLTKLDLVTPSDIRAMRELQPFEEFLGHPVPQFAKYRSP
ncbi:MAG TPA: sulfur transferase domain-containing protein [Gemmatimonadales bacterium]